MIRSRAAAAVLLAAGVAGAMACSEQDPVGPDSAAIAVVDASAALSTTPVCETLTFDGADFVASEQIQTVEVPGLGLTLAVATEPWVVGNGNDEGPFLFSTDGDPNDWRDKDLLWRTVGSASGLCPACEGLGNLLVIGDERGFALGPAGSWEGDNIYGGDIVLSGFPSGGGFFVQSFKIVDNDSYAGHMEPSFQLILDGVVVGESVPQANGSVQTVIPSEHVIDSSLRFRMGRPDWPGSGGVDDIVVCLVPPPEPCLECKGGVVELTLRNNGPAGTVRIESETVVFEAFVPAGGEFTIYGDRSDGKFKNDIKVFVDGVEGTKIHTSCSQPIGPGAVFGDFEVVEAISKDNGLVCPVPPPPPCLECKGGVVELTLRNNGPAGTVRIESETVVFDAFVPAGGEFTIYGDRSDGKFKNDIKVLVDGVEGTKIHTSCSQPIGPGAVFGDLEVVEAISKDNGVVCPVPPPPPCLECKGGVVELTLRNNGPAGTVRIESETVIFDAFVPAGGEFTLYGDRDDGKLKKDIKVFVDGVEVARIHTSCSQPIGPGAVFGDFEVVEAISKDNGKVCPVPEASACEAGKPQVLIMEYTGLLCAASDHDQDPSKVSCTDYAPLGPTVDVRASNKQDPADGGARVWFSGPASLGATIDLDATRAGESRFNADTWVHVFGSDGALLQEIRFHTSCSQPLAEGNQFGSLLLVDFVPEP